MDEDFQKLFKQHINSDQTRLDRIEDKIDKLSDTVIALARAEEKLITLEGSRKNIEDIISIHETRLDEHEKRLQDGDVTLNSITRIFWVALTAAIGALVVYLIGKP